MQHYIKLYFSVNKQQDICIVEDCSGCCNTHRLQSWNYLRTKYQWSKRLQKIVGTSAVEKHPWVDNYACYHPNDNLAWEIVLLRERSCCNLDDHYNHLKIWIKLLHFECWNATISENYWEDIVQWWQWRLPQILFIKQFVFTYTAECDTYPLYQQNVSQFNPSSWYSRSVLEFLYNGDFSSFPRHSLGCGRRQNCMTILTYTYEKSDKLKETCR